MPSSGHISSALQQLVATPLQLQHSLKQNSGICAYHNRSLIIVFLSAVLLLLTSNWLPKVTAYTNPRMPYRPPNARPDECGSIDVRNQCESVQQLHNCTIIRGFLIITHLSPENPDANETCEFEGHSFPLLREITDFLIFHDVEGLRNIRNLFPNLIAIRGRRLFMNYALGITDMPDLETVEFKSLIAIQRGHVFIDDCPKLCNLDKINWDRLTLSEGENHIFPVASDQCETAVCQGCTTKYCWSNEVCQNFADDVLVDAEHGAQHCHEECFGGCYNTTKEGCFLCKGIMDHGSCVKQCPPDKYLVDSLQSCYTESECTKDFGLITQDSKCTANCPNGSIFYINYYDIMECITCEAKKGGTVTIFNLADANRISGCEILNANVLISIRSKIDEMDLKRSFSRLRVIRGYLKIISSAGLATLKFLSDLKKIAVDSDALADGTYGFVLYHNDNLTDLWQPEQLTLEHGSMYVQLNTKLCNRKLREFARNVVHDRTADILQVNDQEVLCEPSKLALDIESLSHRSVRLSWPKAQTSMEVEIMYRAVAAKEVFVEHSELDSNICNRIKWTRLLAFPKEISSNRTHYSYTIKDLNANTRYACLVKTFGPDDAKDARSELMYVTTPVDIPAPPTITITKKTDVSLSIQLQHSDEDIRLYYVLELYELPDNQALLDRRDFCIQPSYLYQDNDGNGDEDHDSCCSRMEEERDDHRFVQNMRSLFNCELDHKENCLTDATTAKPILRLNIDAANGTNVILPHLERFCLYAIQVQSCNEIGCGSYAFHYERTNYSIAGERLDDLQSCRVANTNEFHVRFSEPKHPNGLITSYVVHYRKVVPDEERFKSHIECVTRSQHAANGYQLIAQLNTTFNEVAVRVYSLADGFFTDWVPVSVCQHDTAFTVGTSIVSSQNGEYGLIVFLPYFLLILGAAVAGLCYKYRVWRNISRLHRYLTEVYNWPVLRRDDDRENHSGEYALELLQIPEENTLALD